MEKNSILGNSALVLTEIDALVKKRTRLYEILNDYLKNETCIAISFINEDEFGELTIENIEQINVPVNLTSEMKSLITDSIEILNYEISSLTFHLQTL